MDTLALFFVDGLDDTDRVKLMKKMLLTADGVKDVRTNGLSRVNVLYDPTVASQRGIIDLMRLAGVNTRKG